MNILITGASGLIGRRLTTSLLKQGHGIHALGRTATRQPADGTRYFNWDIHSGYIEAGAFAGVEAIIHLAGAGVADKRWTKPRKKEIADSRILSTRLLYETLSNQPHQVKSIISASAVGYYGDCADKIVTEDHGSASTFLAEVCRNWEEEVSRFENLGVRHVCCRIGIVLSKDGGALPELTRTLSLGLAGYFAKTPLYYPWIHIDDVCGIMMHALENKTLCGSFNTTAPGPQVIKDLMQAILKAKRSNAILAPVPEFALRMTMGEMADMLLSSQNCSSAKLQASGYDFQFPLLQKALEDIYRQ